MQEQLVIEDIGESELRLKVQVLGRDFVLFAA